MKTINRLFAKFNTCNGAENDRRRFIVDYATALTVMTICSGGYFAGLLKYAGVSDQMNGIIAAVPITAAAFQIIGAILMQGIVHEKRFICSGIIIHRGCMVLMFFLPAIFGKSVLCIISIVAAYGIGHFANASVAPAMSNWIISAAPNNIRARYFSQREKYGLLCTATASILVSFILDKFNNPSTQQMGFCIVGTLLLAISVFDVFEVLKICKTEKEKTTKVSLSSLLVPLRDRTFIKVIVLFIMFQASMQIWLPYIGIYLINDLKLKYTLIGAVSVVVSIEKAFIVPFWGKLVSKTSWESVLLKAIGIYALSSILFLLINSHNATWMYIVQGIISNVAWSVLGMAFFNIQFQYIKSEDKTVHVGICGAVSGLSGFIFALIGSQIYGFVNKSNLPIKGMHVLIVLSVIISIIMCIYIYTVLLTNKKQPTNENQKRAVRLD